MAARAEGIRKREGTLRNFIEARYRAWALDQLKSGKYQLERIEADFRAWLDKPMTDLNAWLLEGWRQRQKEAGNQPVTINCRISSVGDHPVSSVEDHLIS